MTLWQSMTRLGVAVALAAAVPAQAADGERGRGMELQKRFAAADVDGEAKNGMPFVYRHFDEIDTAKKGTITMPDIAAFARAKREARKSKAP